MKRIILIGIAFLVTFRGFSQDTAKHKSELKMLKWQILTYYAYGGIVGSSISGDDDSYSSIFFGAELGVGIPVIGVGKQGVIGAELEYASRGSKYDDMYVDGKVVLAYLMLPLFYHYAFTQGLFAEAGLAPGVLLSAKDKYSGNSYNYKDAVNSFNLDALIGLGYVFDKKVGVGLRYSRGINNMNKDGNAKDHNSAFALRLMWLFGSGKR